MFGGSAVDRETRALRQLVFTLAHQFCSEINALEDECRPEHPNPFFLSELGNRSAEMLAQVWTIEASGEIAQHRDRLELLKSFGGVKAALSEAEKLLRIGKVRGYVPEAVADTQLERARELQALLLALRVSMTSARAA
jgi:hypothetical protein